ncbi:MAG TPA: hypothetical protein VMD47_00525 [Candidatus Acidoferrales bacterium]|nr:hypothetical protein [Candidatus Acidoferrales bacterium]
MDDFERLRAIVDADDALQAELLAQTDSTGFIAALTRIADRCDLVIPEARIWQALEEGRAVWYATWA